MEAASVHMAPSYGSGWKHAQEMYTHAVQAQILVPGTKIYALHSMRIHLLRMLGLGSEPPVVSFVHGTMNKLPAMLYPPYILHLSWAILQISDYQILKSPW